MINIKKYAKITWQLANISLQNQMAFPPSFFMAIIGKILRMVLLIITFKVIYFNTALLAGWNYDEIFLLIVTYLTVESLAITTFHRNLSYYMPYMIKRGTFDYLMTKPVNTLFYASFRVIDLMDLTSSLLVVYLWYYYINHYAPHVGILTIALYLLGLACSLIFMYSLLVTVISSFFWTINATGLGRMFENLYQIGRFPTGIFHGFLSFIFYYILPLGIISNMPSAILLNKESGWYLLYGFAFTALLSLAALKLWKKGLKHYSSASS